MGRAFGSLEINFVLKNVKKMRISKFLFLDLGFGLILDPDTCLHVFWYEFCHIIYPTRQFLDAKHLY